MPVIVQPGLGIKVLARLYCDVPSHPVVLVNEGAMSKSKGAGRWWLAFYFFNNILRNWIFDKFFLFGIKSEPQGKYIFCRKFTGVFIVN